VEPKNINKNHPSVKNPEHVKRILEIVTDWNARVISNFGTKRTHYTTCGGLALYSIVLDGDHLFTSAKLAERTGVAKATIAKELRGFVDRGLLEAVENEDDLRVTVYQPTQAGYELFQSFIDWAEGV
jgi:transcription initiation factor IIE alpha subunit